MYQGESVGVEGEAADGIGLGSVLAVAGYRVTDPLGVDAYLVLATGFKRKLNHCVFISVKHAGAQPAAVA